MDAITQLFVVHGFDPSVANTPEDQIAMVGLVAQHFLTLDPAVYNEAYRRGAMDAARAVGDVFGWH